jgi:hypothetical protein
LTCLSWVSFEPGATAVPVVGREFSAKINALLTSCVTVDSRSAHS